jgi:hypothetical protein
MLCDGDDVAAPSVFVIERLATASIVSVSVAVLSAAFVSVVPAGGVIVAVLASVPEAPAETIAVSV